MSAGRLPAHVEVGGLLRQVGAAGGFATVLAKGEHDAGTIVVVIQENGANPRAYERSPRLDGTRIWSLCIAQDVDKEQDFRDYLERRKVRDPDLWIVELDIANGERFIGLPGTRS